MSNTYDLLTDGERVVLAVIYELGTVTLLDIQENAVHVLPTDVLMASVHLLLNYPQPLIEVEIYGKQPSNWHYRLTEEGGLMMASRHLAASPMQNQGHSEGSSHVKAFVDYLTAQLMQGRLHGFAGIVIIGDAMEPEQHVGGLIDHTAAVMELEMLKLQLFAQGRELNKRFKRTPPVEAIPLKERPAPPRYTVNPDEQYVLDFILRIEPCSYEVLMERLLEERDSCEVPALVRAFSEAHSNLLNKALIASKDGIIRATAKGRNKWRTYRAAGVGGYQAWPGWESIPPRQEEIPSNEQAEAEALTPEETVVLFTTFQLRGGMGGLKTEIIFAVMHQDQSLSSISDSVWLQAIDKLLLSQLLAVHENLISCTSMGLHWLQTTSKPPGLRTTPEASKLEDWEPDGEAS